MYNANISFVQSETDARKTISNSKIFRTLPTESGCAMLMTNPIEARNSHEQQRNTPTRDSARLSGDLGLVCRTPRLDPATPGLSLKQKHYHHRPQTRVLEFLVAILAGLQHLQERKLQVAELEKQYQYAEATGTYFTVIYNGEGRKMPILAVVGIAEAGEREVLAWSRGDRENAISCLYSRTTECSDRTSGRYTDLVDPK